MDRLFVFFFLGVGRQLSLSFLLCCENLSAKRALDPGAAGGCTGQDNNNLDYGAIGNERTLGSSNYGHLRLS